MFDRRFPEHWTTNRKLIWLIGAVAQGASAIWKTVTGTLIHITDALASPVQALSVAIEPQQDLTYGDPYPAGGSKNLIPDGTDTNNGYKNNYRLSADGTEVSDSALYISEYFTVTAGTTYVYDAVLRTSVNPSLCFYTENKEYISGVNTGGNLPIVITAPTGAVYCRSTQYKNPATNILQLEVGSTPTTVKPYSNICPITGYTEANIWHTNDNLLDAVTANLLPQNNSKVTVSNGVLTAAKSNTAECGFVVPVKPNTVYTFGYVNNYGINTYVRCAEYSSKPTSYDASSRIRVIINDQSVSTGTVRKVITTSDKAAYVFFGFYRSYNAAAGTYSNWYAKLGNVSTGYSIHEDNNKQISWQTEAGTVYGGYVNATDGTVVKQWVRIHLGGLTWSKSGVRFESAYLASDVRYRVTDGRITVKCEIYNAISNRAGNVFNSSANDFEICCNSSSRAYFMVKDSRFTTGSELKTALNGVYALIEFHRASEVSYNIEPISVDTLKGENNIWADCGDTTLTYQAVPETAFSDKVDTGMADYMTLTE